MIRAARMVHLTALAFWMGATLFLFVLAPGVFAALPRPVAGDAMNAIFPRFYSLSFLCAGLAAVTLPLLPERTSARGALLTVAIALLLVAGPVLGARVAAIRVQVVAQKAERAAGRSAPELDGLEREFGKLHGVVMALDLSVFVLGSTLLWLGLARLEPPGLEGPVVRAP